MKFDKQSILFMAAVTDVIAMWFSAICLASSIMGKHQARDMFWYGMATMVTGVIFKTLWDSIE